MIKFGSGPLDFLPHWSMVQWLSSLGILILVGLAGVIIYAAFFALPGGIFMVEDGVEVETRWREVMDIRSERRNRIPKKAFYYLGFAVGLLIMAGGVAVWAW